jgi:hypothetical protein
MHAIVGLCKLKAYTPSRRDCGCSFAVTELCVQRNLGVHCEMSGEADAQLPLLVRFLCSGWLRLVSEGENLRRHNCETASRRSPVCCRLRREGQQFQNVECQMA